MHDAAAFYKLHTTGAGGLATKQQQGAAGTNTNSNTSATAAVQGPAVLVGTSSDGVAVTGSAAAGLPLSSMGSNSGGKQRVIWGNRTPLRKDASW